MWFNLLPTIVKYPDTRRCEVESTERVLRNDSFNVGIIPADILREFEMEYTMEWLPKNSEEVQKFVDDLLSIKKKKGFDLEIRLRQNKFKLNPWPRAFDMFRPVLEGFEQEGGRVRIYYEDDCTGNQTIELNEVIKNPGSDWKAHAIKFFESVRIH
jgi:hypothetical protein